MRHAGLEASSRRDLFENMLDGYAHCRMLYEDGAPTDFVYLDVNHAFAQLTGLHGVVGKRVSEVVPGLREANPELFEIYGRVARTGQPERFEIHLPSLRRWFAISVYSPSPEHFVAVFDNITERKQAEESQRRAEAELREAQRLAHFGNWYWDVQTDQVTASEETFRMFGLDPTRPVAELRAQERQLYVPGTWERVQACVEEALRTGTGYELMIEARRTDGRPLWIRARGEVVHGAEGRIVGLRGTNQDITAHRLAAQERERLLREMAQQARLLDTIVGATDSRLAYLDQDLRYVRVNAAYADNARMAPEDFVGRHRLEVFPNAPEVAAMYQQVLDTGEPGLIEEYTGIPRYRPEVGPRTVRIEAVPVSDEQCQVVGLVTSMVDVTESVRQRERLLATERARAGIAENLNNEIAHRVKNNLAMISGLLQMQRLNAPNEEAATALREAVGRVRTFAALHDQMYRSDTEPVNLLTSLQQVGRIHAELAGPERVAITVEGEAFWCDPRVATNLAVVANELITNALKHGSAGLLPKPVVHARLHLRPRGLYLFVWNSGDPPPREGEAAAKPGLGLALVRDMVIGQYGGRFQLSASRGGALAEVFIPKQGMRRDAAPR